MNDSVPYLLEIMHNCKRILLFNFFIIHQKLIQEYKLKSNEINEKFQRYKISFIINEIRLFYMFIIK